MEPDNNLSDFQRQVGEKENRKLKAKQRQKQSVWQGFGVFGIIGWSVAVPTVLFVMLGMWMDERFERTPSYTLALLIAGLCLGCLNAWFWVDKKLKELQDNDDLKNKKNE